MQIFANGEEYVSKRIADNTLHCLLADRDEEYNRERRERERHHHYATKNLERELKYLREHVVAMSNLTTPKWIAVDPASKLDQFSRIYNMDFAALEARVLAATATATEETNKSYRKRNAELSQALAAREGDVKAAAEVVEALETSIREKDKQIANQMETIESQRRTIRDDREALASKSVFLSRLKKFIDRTFGPDVTSAVVENRIDIY